jgi:hypothetical protein
MGYISLDIRNLGCCVLCRLVRDNPVAILIDGYRCPLPDPCPLDLAGLVPACGEYPVCRSGATVKKKTCLARTLTRAMTPLSELKFDLQPCVLLHPNEIRTACSSPPIQGHRLTERRRTPQLGQMMGQRLIGRPECCRDPAYRNKCSLSLRKVRNGRSFITRYAGQENGRKGRGQSCCLDGPPNWAFAAMAEKRGIPLAHMAGTASQDHGVLS